MERKIVILTSRRSAKSSMQCSLLYWFAFYLVNDNIIVKKEIFHFLLVPRLMTDIRIGICARWAHLIDNKSFQIFHLQIIEGWLWFVVSHQLSLLGSTTMIHHTSFILHSIISHNNWDTFPTKLDERSGREFFPSKHQLSCKKSIKNWEKIQMSKV